jgi:hypothetical protein
LMTHKMSYQRRDPNPVFIVRRGFSFDSFLSEPEAAGADASMERRTERVEVVVAFVRARLKEGLKLTPRKLEKDHMTALGMSQAAVRIAVDTALQFGRLIETKLPEEERKGGRQAYLVPAD